MSDDDQRARVPTLTGAVIPPIRPAAVVHEYSPSSVGVGANALVCQLILGANVPVGAAVEAHVRNDMVITMSWALAKTLHQMLGKLIASYEETEGPVAIPRSIQASLDTALQGGKSEQ